MTKANMPVIMRAGILTPISGRDAYWTAVSAFRGTYMPGNLYHFMNAQQVAA